MIHATLRQKWVGRCRQPPVGVWGHERVSAGDGRCRQVSWAVGRCQRSSAGGSNCRRSSTRVGDIGGRHVATMTAQSHKRCSLEKMGTVYPILPPLTCFDLYQILITCRGCENLPVLKKKSSMQLLQSATYRPRHEKH